MSIKSAIKRHVMTVITCCVTARHENTARKPLALVIAVAVLLNTFAAISDAGAALVSARNLRLETSADHTGVLIELDTAVKLSVRTYSNPYRVVVDLIGAKFDKPDRRPRQGRGHVASLHFGPLGKNIARLQLAVTSPVSVKAAFVPRSRRSKGGTLRIILAETSLDAFRAAPFHVRYRGNRRTRDAAAIAGPQRPAVIIDAGHGGKYPGAVGAGGTREKDVVLAFSRALKRELQAADAYDVFLTRPHDLSLSLYWRKSKARYLGRSGSRPALLLSIHADAVPKGFGTGTRGASVYVYADRPVDDEAKLLVAQRDPDAASRSGTTAVRADKLPLAPLSAQEQERRKRSGHFAELLLEALSHSTKLRWTSPRGADFYVLDSLTVPAVLLELGYLTNRADERLLASEEWRQRVAKAVAEAIKTYFADSASAPSAAVPNSAAAPAQ